MYLTLAPSMGFVFVNSLSQEGFVCFKQIVPISEEGSEVSAVIAVVEIMKLRRTYQRLKRKYCGFRMIGKKNIHSCSN